MSTVEYIKTQVAEEQTIDMAFENLGLTPGYRELQKLSTEKIRQKIAQMCGYLANKEYKNGSMGSLSRGLGVINSLFEAAWWIGDEKAREAITATTSYLVFGLETVMSPQQEELEGLINKLNPEGLSPDKKFKLNPSSREENPDILCSLAEKIGFYWLSATERLIPRDYLTGLPKIRPSIEQDGKERMPITFPQAIDFYCCLSYLAGKLEDVPIDKDSSTLFGKPKSYMPRQVASRILDGRIRHPGESATSAYGITRVDLGLWGRSSSDKYESVWQFLGNSFRAASGLEGGHVWPVRIIPGTAKGRKALEAIEARLEREETATSEKLRALLEGIR